MLDRTLTVDRIWIIIATISSIAITFIVDLMIPLGVSVGVPYVITILIVFWLHDARLTLITAVLCTLLVIVGFLLSPEGGEIWKVIANRMLAILTIWITTWFSLVSERALQKLSVNEEGTQAILTTAGDSIITIDEQGLVESYNHAAEKQFGYSADKVIGHNIKMLMPQPYAAEHDEYLANYRRSGEKKIIGIGREVTGQRQDGSTFPMELSVAEVKLGDRVIFTGIVRDISERKQFEEQLKEAKTTAETANHAKSQFLASMSHELRTPLNAIIGYSELMQEEMEELNQDAYIDDMQKIQGAGRHLLGLINDTLDLSKIEAGKVELNIETFAVETLLEDVVQTMMDKRGNRLEVSQPGDAQGEMQSDQTRIRQVLLNLLSNAAKFTENGLITLTAKRETLDNRDWLIFAVGDNGIGMNEEQLQRIFEEFGQADKSTTSLYGGTGLGLSISRRFCQMLYGDISVKSVLGEGSTFTVRLPAKMRPAFREEANVDILEQTGTSADGALVLVIDDEIHARELMTRRLRKARFQVALAANGREGLELARKLDPVAITLDAIMPDMDGWTVLQKLKADPELANIPVVMCTMVDDEKQGFSLGVSDYLTKPVDAARLLKAIHRFCAQDDCDVLVVEDDASQRHLISKALNKDDWQVREAENGLAALELLREKTADIILLDLEMPQMDGFEFVEALQDKASWQEIPIVVLTSRDLSQAERSCLNGYVEAIMSKGEHGTEQVIRELRAVIRQSKSAR